MISGQDLLDIAGHLVSNASFRCAETRYRSAISRAYYGAFHSAVQFLSECGKTVPGGPQGHEAAYRYLYNTAVQPARDAAHNLNDLRGVRNKADYQLSWRGLDSQANARDKVEMALLVKSKLDECRTAAHRSKIEAALKKL